MESVLIVGSGNGGLAMAADLSLRGYQVHMGELPGFEEGLDPVREREGVNLEALDSTSLPEGFAPVQTVSGGLGRFLHNFSGLVLVVAPAFAHRKVARVLGPHLHPELALVLCPGYMGTLEMVNHLLSAGSERLLERGILLGEMESLIYACRKKGPAHIWIRGYKRGLRITALPADRTDQLMTILQGKFDYLEPAENILEGALSNANALIHTPLMLMNGARIESQGEEFLFYHQGMTPSVGRLIEAMDRERLEIGMAYGLMGLRDIFTQDLGWYSHQGARGRNVHDTHVTNPIYRWSKAPDTLDHRYVTEDVPYGLVLMEDLARLGGVRCPTITSMINLFNAISDRDLRESGRTLKSLGLQEMSPEDIRDLVDRGNLQKVGIPTGD